MNNQKMRSVPLEETLSGCEALIIKDKEEERMDVFLEETLPLREEDQALIDKDELILVKSMEGPSKLVATCYQIFIKSLEGVTMPLAVKSSDSIGLIKSRIPLDTKLSKDWFRLIYAGKELQDGKTLAEYDIKHESTLYLNLRLHGGVNQSKGPRRTARKEERKCLPPRLRKLSTQDIEDMAQPAAPVEPPAPVEPVAPVAPPAPVAPAVLPAASSSAPVTTELDNSIRTVQFEFESLHYFITGFHLDVTAGNSTKIHDFAESVCAYRVLHPSSEEQLNELARKLYTRYRETIKNRIKEKVEPSDLLTMLRVFRTDMLMMDQVVPDAPHFCSSLEDTEGFIKQYLGSAFSNLQQDVSETLKLNEGIEEECLQVALKRHKKVVMDGSLGVLRGFNQLLHDKLVVKSRDSIVHIMKDGFENFFKSLAELLNDRYLFISKENNILIKEDQDSLDATEGEKVLGRHVLVLAQLAIFIERIAIPIINKKMATCFSGGSDQDYEGIYCTFQAAGEKFLRLYIKMKSLRMSVPLRKSFTTPNRIKLEALRNEVKQILTCRSDSNGDTASSQSSRTHEIKNVRSNAQRARGHAELFKQKMEITTKVEYTQESVVSTMVKLYLMSFQEFVLLQTFDRIGLQLILLDTQFLRTRLREFSEDKSDIDSLLDEVTFAATERSLDSSLLEPSAC